MALMHKNPKTGKWEWDDTAQRTATNSLQRFISNDSHPADIAKFHDTESAASKPAAMNSALNAGRRVADYRGSTASFHDVESAASKPEVMKTALTAGNEVVAKENAPLYQKAADIAFNRVPSALAGASVEKNKLLGKMKEQGNDPGFWGQAVSPELWEAGLEGFKKGVTGKERYNFDQALGELGMKPGLTRNLIGGTLDIVASPGVGIGGKLVTKGASRLFPEAPKLVRGALASGGTGFIQGAGSSIGQGATASEALERGAEDAAMWAGTDLGIGLAGNVMKRTLGRGTNSAAEKETQVIRNLRGSVDNPSIAFKKGGSRPFANQDEVNAFVDEAVKGVRKFETRPIKEISSDEAAKIQKLIGIDPTGFIHEMSNTDIYHANKGHTNEIKEAAKGQIPITKDDLKAIPSIISSYDDILKGSTKGGIKSVIYKKRVNGTIYYVEVVFPKKKLMRSKTMWKEPSAINNAAQDAPPVYTSKIDSSMIPSTNINIPPEGLKGNGGQGPNFKRTQQPSEIQELNQGLQKRLGPFTFGKGVEHAPEVMSNPEFQAANELSKIISGREVVPFKGSEDIHGANVRDRIYLNANTRQPVAYVTAHELAHSIETASPETFSKLHQIVREHVADSEGLWAHYEKLGYKPEDLPKELTADAMAESMLENSFWARVRQQAPEILKPMLDALDAIIAKITRQAGPDMTISPYLKDIETMRSRLADEYRGYLSDVQSGKVQPGESMAAKQDISLKANRKPEESRGWSFGAKNNYGLPKVGLDALKDVKIPAKGSDIGEGFKPRSLDVSAANAPWATPGMTKRLGRDIQPGEAGAYEPVSNEQTLKEAQQAIQQDSGAVLRRILSSEPSSRIDNTAGMLLVQQANKDGDIGMAVDLTEALAKKATESGQAIQALSMWGRLTPEGMLKYGQKVINLTNEQRKKQRIKKPLKLSEEAAGKIVNLMKQAEGLEGDAKSIKTAQALEVIAEQVPPTMLRKISTLQTMAQLLNLKTATRNIVGNLGFGVLENVKDVIATPLDAATGLFTGNRTKVLPSLTTQAKGFAKGAKQGLEDAMLGIDRSNMRGGKFDIPTTPTFRKGPLAVAEKAMNIELRATDRAFYQAAYDESLRQQMAAVAKSKKPPTAEEMHDIAHYEALYRTFQDDSAAAHVFSGLKRLLNREKDFGLGDLLIKYPKTPGNLLSRGIEYSPAGFVKTVMEIVKPMIGREFNQKAFVEATSRALTGSATLFGTGALLHHVGIITSGPADDQDVEALKKQAGFGQYRFNASALKRFVMSGFDSKEAKIRPGDITVSYDWFQPDSIGLAMGADWDKNKTNGATGKLLSLTTFGKVATFGKNALTTGINSFAEQPVVSGLAQITGKQDAATGLANALQGVPASFVPTLFNQVKQIADNQKRNTYSPDYTQELGFRAMSKVPGLESQLPKSYGTLGQSLKTYQEGDDLTSNSVWNVFVNPSFVNRYKPTKEAQMVIDIFNNTGETKQVPRVIKKYFMIPGEGRLDLTAKEYSAMQKQVGELTKAGFSKISDSLSDTEKIKAMVDVMADAGQEARMTVLENRGIPLPDSWMEGAGYLIRAINKGDTGKASAYIMKNSSNNAFKIYDYGKKHGMVDDKGNPDASLNYALAEVWAAQTPNQAKTAAFNFLYNACQNNNQEQAVKWAQIAKQSGLTWGKMKTRLRQKARPSQTGSRTPTIQDIYAGGYKVDSQTLRRMEWVMNQ